jgi:predicted alpha/beta hydrolase family esterase
MWILLLCFLARSEQILFFGGYRSQPAHMQDVERLAEAESVILEAIAYPSQTSTYEAAVRDGKPIIDQWVRRLNSTPALKIKIVGHSSGAALAIEVARQVQPRSRVVLVILDGFLPSQTFQQNIQTECWAAIDPTSQLRSYNYESTKTCQRFNVLEYSGCKTSMCLHFALVNENARQNVITNSNYGTRGYENIALPTFWF